MKKHQLTKRRSDLLDQLVALRNQRRLAYEQGDTQQVTKLNLAIKAIRLENGWSEVDAHAEFEEHQRDYSVPFIKPLGNPWIKYDLLDENGKPCKLSFNIAQLSKYHTQRDMGNSHSKAVLAISAA